MKTNQTEMMAHKTGKSLTTLMTLALGITMAAGQIAKADAIDDAVAARKAARASAKAATNNPALTDTNALNDTNAITTNKVFGTTYGASGNRAGVSGGVQYNVQGAGVQGGSQAGLVDKSLAADPRKALVQSVAKEFNTTVAKERTVEGMQITDYTDKHRLTWDDSDGILYVALYQNGTKVKSFMASEDQTGAQLGEIRGTLKFDDSNGKNSITGFFNNAMVLSPIQDEKKIILYSITLKNGNLKIVTDNQQNTR